MTIYVKYFVLSKKSNFPSAPKWKTPPLNHYFRIRSKLLLDDCGVLYRRFSDIADERFVPVIPSSLREFVMRDFHIGTGCHLEPERMYHTLQLSCYWPGMSDDGVNFCSSFTTCQQFKPYGPKKAPLGAMPIGRPWEFVATDISKVPVSVKGCQYTLVFLCSKITLQNFYTPFP